MLHALARGGGRLRAPQRRGVFRIHFLVLVDHGRRGHGIELVECLERRPDHQHRQAA